MSPLVIVDDLPWAAEAATISATELAPANFLARGSFGFSLINLICSWKDVNLPLLISFSISPLRTAASIWRFRSVDLSKF